MGAPDWWMACSASCYAANPTAIRHQSRTEALTNGARWTDSAALQFFFKGKSGHEMAQGYFYRPRAKSFGRTALSQNLARRGARVGGSGRGRLVVVVLRT